MDIRRIKPQDNIIKERGIFIIYLKTKFTTKVISLIMGQHKFQSCKNASSKTVLNLAKKKSTF